MARRERRMDREMDNQTRPGRSRPGRVCVSANDGVGYLTRVQFAMFQ